MPSPISGRETRSPSRRCHGTIRDSWTIGVEWIYGLAFERTVQWVDKVASFWKKIQASGPPGRTVGWGAFGDWKNSHSCRHLETRVEGSLDGDNSSPDISLHMRK